VDAPVLAALIAAGATLLAAVLTALQRRKQQKRLMNHWELDREHHRLLQTGEHRYKSHERFESEMSKTHDAYLMRLDEFAKGHLEAERIRRVIRALSQEREEGAIAPAKYAADLEEQQARLDPWEKQSREAQDAMYNLRDRIKSLADEDLAQRYKDALDAVGPVGDGNWLPFEEAKAKLIEAYRERVALVDD
jgi:hypothetical protein